MLTMYLHTSIVFGFILATEKKNSKGSFLGYLVVVLCFIAAILTKTRCNAGIALTLFWVLAFIPKENIYILILRYMSFICALVLMVSAILLTVWWILPIEVRRNVERQTVSIELNVLYQPYFIHHISEMAIIRDFPLVGVGLGMYNRRQGDYIRWDDVKKSYQQIYPNLQEKDKNVYKAVDPHSLYLGIGAETGLLGLGGMLFFFWQIIVCFFRKLREKVDAQESYISGVFLAGFVGFLFNALYVDMLTVRSFWFLIAMGVIYISLNIHKKTALAE